MKKITAVLISVFMMISAVGAVLAEQTVVHTNDTQTTNAAEEIMFNDVVFVGGVEVTAENKDDVLGDGGSVKYNDVTDTLTLTDARIINKKGHGIYAYGINLTVVGVDTDAEGDNSVSGKSTIEGGLDDEGYEYTITDPGSGIYVEGDGYEGNGALTIIGSFGKISGEDYHGITAYKDVDISATIDEISCTGGIDSAINSYFGSVIIKDSAVIGKIISNEYNGIEADKDIIISGNVDEIFGGGYAGIHSTSGDVFVSGDVESIAGHISGIEAYKGINWDVDGNEFYVGGSVKIGGNVGEISGSVIGVYTEEHLNLSGSAKITATDLETEDARAISVGGELIIPDTKNFITEPEEYEINTHLAQTYVDETGFVEVYHNTIYGSDGKLARTIEFKAFVNPFRDVKVSDWYYEDVRYAVEKDLFGGITETTFAPNVPLTRAMLVTVLYRAEGKPIVSGITSFSDLAPGLYYLDAVCWAQINNIVSGITETEFAPNENITREQIAAIMYRYAEYKGMDVTIGEDIELANYDDFGSVHKYAILPIKYAIGSGVMSGKSERMINPRDNATRAEAAAILHRFIEADN